MGQLHVVVTCTDRKTKSVPSALRAESLTRRKLPTRMDQWTSRLDSSLPEGRLPAERLYSGDHWTVAQQIASSSGKIPLSITVWICSAGYGLVEFATPLHPYAATFSPGHADSVSPDGNFETCEWWNRLSKWRPPGYRGPRTITALAQRVKRERSAFLLVAASRVYLDALQDDLEKAARVLSESGRLAVISVGTASGDSPDDREVDSDAPASVCLLPAKARLTKTVGGAMQSLNVRLARHAAERYSSWFPESQKLALQFKRWSASAPVLPSYARRKCEDKSLVSFIQKQIRSDRAASASSSLRRLRDSGLACEQQRFSDLFRATKKKLMISEKKHGARRGPQKRQ